MTAVGKMSASPPGSSQAVSPPPVSPTARRTSPVPDILLVASILLGELQLLVMFFRRLWSSEHYRLIPLVVLASACMLYRRWPSDRMPLRWHERLIGLSSLGFGLAALACGVMLWSPWIAAVGALFTTLFLLIHFAAGQSLARLGSAWLLLWLLLPLPGKLDQELVSSLQRVASRWSSAWLDALDYNHVLSGSVIHVPGQRILVDEACHGAYSFYVLLSLTAILVVALRYPALPATFLLLSTGGWAIVASTIGITSLVAFRVAGVEVSAGMRETALASSIFIFVIAMLLSTDRLLLFLFAPDEFQPRSKDEPPASETLGGMGRPLAGKWLSSAATIAFLFLGLAQLLPNVRDDTKLENSLVEVDRVRIRVEESAVLPLAAGWELVGFELREGTRTEEPSSANWRVRRGDTSAVLSLIFPLSGWREVASGYTGEGWEVVERRVLSESAERDGESATEGEGASGAVATEALGTAPWSEVDSEAVAEAVSESATTAVGFDMENATGGFACVMLSLFDQHGAEVPNQDDSGWSLRNLKSVLFSRFTKRGVELDEIRPVYGFGVFVASRSPFTSEERQRIADLYFAARRQVVLEVTDRARPLVSVADTPPL